MSDLYDFLKKIGNHEAIKGPTVIDIHKLQVALRAGGAFGEQVLSVESWNAVEKAVSFDDKKIKLHRN